MRVIAVVVATLLMGCVPEQSAPSPSVTALPSPRLSESPIASVSPTASPIASPTSSATATPQVFATIVPSYVESFVPAQTRGIGQLAGDWVFMLRRATLMGTLPHAPGGERIAAMDRAVDTLTLVPVAGPDSRAVTVATFLSDLGEGIVATNHLSAQFSPEGDRLVLAVGTRGPQGGVRLGLVILDLASGNVFGLTTDPTYHDDTPSWSPDGAWIVFSRRTVLDRRDAAVWIVAATPGSPPRPLMSGQVDAPRRTYNYGWTPDGRRIAMTRGGSGIEFADPFFSGVCPSTTPVCVPPPMTFFDGSVSGSRAAMDWRSKTPQFVGAFAEDPNGAGATPSVAVADAPASPQRTIARSTASSGGALLRPRWRPGGDEVLYLDSPAPSGLGEHRLLVVDPTSGASRQVLARTFPVFAEWTPDGAGIAWVEAVGVAAAVRVMSADGAAERSVYATGGIPEAPVITVDFGTLRL